MTITLNGTTGITNDGGYTGDGVVFADATPSNTLVTTTGGNVGVGTSSPSYKLDVASSSNVVAKFNYSGGASGYVYADANIVSYGSSVSGSNSINFYDSLNLIRLYTSGSERMRIDSSGYITSLPTYNNGSASGANMVVNSSGLFLRSVSALKYKQDVRDLESIDITKFRPVRYKSKCEGDDQEKDHFGVIADEVHEAGVTELVNYGAEGEVEGFHYDRLAVVLLKTIQEQQAIITEQSLALQDLKARIETLENK